MQGSVQDGRVMAHCRICSRCFQPHKSRALCDRHYWQVRRLREKSTGELEQLEREAALTRACIEAARAEGSSKCGVAPKQPRREYHRDCDAFESPRE